MTKNLFKQETLVSFDARMKLKQQRPMVLWFTGLSGSGKSTLAIHLNAMLHAQGRFSYLLDGDNVRMGLNADLDFSDAGRKENIRRIAEVAKLFVDAGEIVLTAFVSPFAEDRQQAKEIIGEEHFLEIYVSTALEECEARDTKGLYKKARSGEIANFTGISSPYEAPQNPDIEIKTFGRTVQDCTSDIYKHIQNKIN